MCGEYSLEAPRRGERREVEMKEVRETILPPTSLILGHLLHTMAAWAWSSLPPRVRSSKSEKTGESIREDRAAERCSSDPVQVLPEL